MRARSTASSGWENRQSSTPVAFSENMAKFTPSPSQVAPSGYGWPGQTRISERLAAVECGALRRGRDLSRSPDATGDGARCVARASVAGVAGGEAEAPARARVAL